jgi:hypothetical protein
METQEILVTDRTRRIVDNDYGSDQEVHRPLVVYCPDIKGYMKLSFIPSKRYFATYIFGERPPVTFVGDCDLSMGYLDILVGS